MWARAPVSRAASTTWAMARSSASLGREARNPAYRGPAADGDASIVSRSSAWTITRPSNPATSARAALRPEASRGGNSSTPECSRKHLKPKTPASCSGRRSARLPGMAPPQNPTSMKACPWAASCLACRASTVVVGGMLLSGMSTIVVTPPAAAARVALAKPSHSVRPGSLTCTWVSTRPGSRTTSSSRRMVSSPERAAPAELSGSTATIRPPLMPTAAGPSPPAVTARSARMRTSHLMAVSSRGRSSSRTG